MLKKNFEPKGGVSNEYGYAKSSVKNYSETVKSTSEIKSTVSMVSQQPG